MGDVLRDQIDYYDARASVYDDFWHRRGTYALTEPLAGQWRADADEVTRFVSSAAKGDVLELAAGTGIFTQLLARSAQRVDAVDASPTMLHLNRERIGDNARVSYEVADLFAWRPTRTYDLVFFSFWLSHVPLDRFAAFWEMVGSALAPGGRAVFADSRPHPNSSHDGGTDFEDRSLPDGRIFRIVKRYWTPEALAGQLHESGWDADVRSARNDLILFGCATPAR